jgi:hypothetical protein
MSSVSSPRPDEVLRAVIEGFPDETPSAITEILAQYGVERHERERERVQLAIVRLSEGDVGQLGYLVRAAKQDYRDVLYWLELGTGHRDPVVERFYEALATPEATPRRLELLKEGIPALTRVAVLGQHEYAPHRDQLRALEVVAGRLKVELRAVNVRRATEFEAALSAIVGASADGLLVLTCAMSQLNVKELARRALEARVPGMCEVSEFTAAGGLLSYGPSAAERQQRARAEMGRRVQTLRREPPASAAVVAPKLELVINLKTGKALGLTIPQSLLERADQIIE